MVPAGTIGPLSHGDARREVPRTFGSPKPPYKTNHKNATHVTGARRSLFAKGVAGLELTDEDMAAAITPRTRRCSLNEDMKASTGSSRQTRHLDITMASTGTSCQTRHLDITMASTGSSCYTRHLDITTASTGSPRRTRHLDITTARKGSPPR